MCRATGHHVLRRHGFDLLPGAGAHVTFYERVYVGGGNSCHTPIAFLPRSSSTTGRGTRETATGPERIRTHHNTYKRRTSSPWACCATFRRPAAPRNRQHLLQVFACPTLPTTLPGSKAMPAETTRQIICEAALVCSRGISQATGVQNSPGERKHRAGHTAQIRQAQLQQKLRRYTSPHISGLLKLCLLQVPKRPTSSTKTEQTGGGIVARSVSACGSAWHGSSRSGTTRSGTPK